jgi:peptidoglycan hydrolase CwlO-like protein
MKWWKAHKELRTEIGRLEHQIKLMQEHIETQKEENLSLKSKIRELEMMWDIETTKKY